jgi:hypothetical protein
MVTQYEVVVGWNAVGPIQAIGSGGRTRIRLPILRRRQPGLRKWLSVHEYEPFRPGGQREGVTWKSNDAFYQISGSRPTAIEFGRRPEYDDVATVNCPKVIAQLAHHDGVPDAERG